MFKKNTWIIVVVVSMLLSSEMALAGNGSIVMRTNLIDPSHQESYFSNDINFYLTVSEKLSFGFETSFSPKSDYLKVKPFATWAVDKSWSLIGGFSSDSSDHEYVLGGLSYFKRLSESNSIYISACYYVGTNEGSSDYVDSFAEVKHNFGNGFALAIEVIYDYWPSEGNNWMLIGPVLHYAVSDKVDLFVRVAGENNLEQWNSIDFRIGATYSF
ncbi:MAG: hypothetical protein WC682_04085 [Parcubacteria group bacterium]|jgi:hypothetical protein